MPKTLPQTPAVSFDRVHQSRKSIGKRLSITAKNAIPLSSDEQRIYDCAQNIMAHVCVQAPLKHKSGHPGGPLSAFTFCYMLSARRNSSVDQPLRYSPGHLSLLAYALQWMFGRERGDKRLESPQAIIEHFRTPSGLPGHVEAGIGDIPFGTGPLGKGVSEALGVALGLKLQKKEGWVDCVLADGDSQEGQVMEAFRLAPVLKLSNLVVHGDWNDVQLSSLPSKTFATDMAGIAHACGWHVIEVENGNDPSQVALALDQAEQLKNTDRPIFICYYTTMGHGVLFMEEASNTGNKNYHGSPLTSDEAAIALKELPPLEDLVEQYQPVREKEIAKMKKLKPIETDFLLPASVPQTFTRTVTTEKGGARKDFGAVHIKNLMSQDPRIIVLHADLAGSGGFDSLAKDFPDRVINVGVAEANMVMMAAGLRQTGMIPLAYTFAAFVGNEARASLRLIDMNCGHTRCGVIIDGTHSGVSVGEDGETHQEQSYASLPFRNTVVWVPADSNHVGAMAQRAVELCAEGHRNVCIFSARSDHPQLLKPDGTAFYDAHYHFSGTIDLLRGSNSTDDVLTIVAAGICVHHALSAAEKLASEEPKLRGKIRLLVCGSIRPLDAATIARAALETRHLIVVEDHSTEGGLSSQIADLIADFQLPCSLRRLGLSQYYPSAKAEDCFLFAGIDADSIEQAMHDELKSEVCGGEDALVTCLFAMQKNMLQSRFRDAIAPLIDYLHKDNGAIESLRKFWQTKTCDPNKLPKTDALRKMLG